MSLADDLRYSIRGLRRQPGFALAAATTLAIGVGAATAIFTVVDGVLLKALRYPNADRLVAIETRRTDLGRSLPRTAGGDLEDLRRQTDTFDAFSYYHGGEMGVQVDGVGEFVGAYLVDPDFFHVFSVPPLVGRTFRDDDARRAAIVADRFAARHFGSSAAALGRTIAIEGTSYEVVGVMPPTLRFPRLAEVWAAAPFVPSNRNRSGYNYYSVAALRPMVSPAAATARLDSLARRLGEAFPDTNRNKTFVAVPLQEELAAPVRSTLLLLVAAVGLVLLIACANVANLTLARGTARVREFAVRAALGAGRAELVSQAIAESVVLSIVAAVAGVGLAGWGTRALLSIGARFVPAPLVGAIRIDWRVLMFAAFASFAAALLAVVPAWQATGADSQLVLRHAGPLGTVSAGSSRLRGALVVIQIALSLTLAIDASLLFRTMLALHEADLGFRSDGILVTYAHVPARTLAEALKAGRIFDDLFAQLRRLPGVVSAAGAMGLPAGQYDSNGSFAIEGKQEFRGDLRSLPIAGLRLASPGYFATMGIPLRGRDFDDGDVYERPFVAIVSESLARQNFPNDDPIGHRIMCGLDSPNWMTIVGVAGDVRQSSPAARPGPELYMPLRQHPFNGNEVQVVVRTTRDPQTAVPVVQNVIRQVNPEIAMKSTTMTALVSDSVAAQRFRSALAATFALLALLLAISGTYAVVSYTTVRRTSEFGLRSALGARPAAIVVLVIRGAAKLAVAGVLLGALLALAGGRLLRAMLFSPDSSDFSTYVVVATLVLPVILLAAALPAWRASRVDPLVALRTE